VQRLLGSDLYRRIDRWPDVSQLDGKALQALFHCRAFRVLRSSYAAVHQSPPDVRSGVDVRRKIAALVQAAKDECMHPEPGRIRRSTKCYRRAAAELPAKSRLCRQQRFPYAPIQTSVAIKQTTLGSCLWFGASGLLGYALRQFDSFAASSAKCHGNDG